MRRTRTSAAVIGIAALSLAACATGTTSDSADDTTTAASTETQEQMEGGAGGEVGVFTWWADGSEKVGLDAMVGVFNEQFPNDTFVNLAVAGGAGTNAKAKLASDLENGNPPDSFQGHAGAELTDYIVNSQVEPVNDVIEELGGSSVFPQDLLDRITVEGNIYSVPSNIHRSNVVWANPTVLEAAGVTETPGDMDAWLADMQKVKDSGVETPLSIGGTWTVVHLFENVLLADLGPEDYAGLFDGSTPWDSEGVQTAVDHMTQLLAFANNASSGDDWVAPTDMVIDGTAAYNVMGDWAVGQFNSRDQVDGEDYVYFPVPGTDGVFNFLADSFTLPVGAPNPEGSKDWLRTVGSVDGQQAFNLAKGSIPARTDVPSDDFPTYQQTAIESFANDTIASSIAHGAAVPLAWLDDISTATAKFYSSKDGTVYVTDLTAAADKALG
ncbi:extracellular solute-binding protein [Nostocoides sp. F2B08]|uniref:ABC transporter substrate-binding protein n=1 Tax=Nostocoides sp. F2B08 TaxID=2653936 RepID=UPI001263549D|nr:ABC transporter substrate-binding protein [Tetrasphaera sp. F2B08]KAB7745691.1 extracellular solute-binding protein [Tetrasphaera sp. F2B08]